MISIVLVTFNRLHLLERCFKSVLARTSAATKEIIVWNNGSTDGTSQFLGGMADQRLQVVNGETNIGTNAFARAFRRATQPFMIELDDDVIEAPESWDQFMLDGFLRIPRAGYVAANVIDDGKSVASEIFYRKELHRFRPADINGVPVLDGPVGGYCTMTSRDVYNRVGGFRESRRFAFWHEDASYACAVSRAGYVCTILRELCVLHASGPAYSSDATVEEEKRRYYAWCARKQSRRTAVKTALERVPLVRRLNAKFGWYEPPRRR
jgi:GT2 family glycosyltransferase